jgi:hypothetical protein
MKNQLDLVGNLVDKGRHMVQWRKYPILIFLSDHHLTMERQPHFHCSFSSN